MNSPDVQLALRHYRLVALITLVAVYVLIVVGSTVRASGAGMGCPDWPTCFGQWIPPTSEAQLPANYQQIYADRGYAETRFNVVKTWTEYTNRLLGVTIGLLILVTAIMSWRLRHYDRRITIASIAAFLMVGFQGWLGSRVVASNLQPGMITLHMLMALAIVAVLMFGLAQARREIMASQAVGGIHPHFTFWLSVVIGLTVLQVAMGTQVREMTDIISKSQGEAMRTSWVEFQSWTFYIHRSFSWLLIFANLWLARLLIGSLGWRHTLTRLTLATLAVIVLSVFSGVALNHLGMPAFVQPTHLLAASLLFGLQFLIWLSARHARNDNPGEGQSNTGISSTLS